MIERYRIEDNAIYKDNKIMTCKELCDELNDLEQIRLRKNREIKRFRDREEKYQRVISGVMTFLQLHLNNELWSDWDD